MGKRARVGADGKTLYDEKGRFAGSLATAKEPKTPTTMKPVKAQHKDGTLRTDKTSIGDAHSAMWNAFVKSQNVTPVRQVEKGANFNEALAEVKQERETRKVQKRKPLVSDRLKLSARGKLVSISAACAAISIGLGG